jgi:hypothetical protein
MFRSHIVATALVASVLVPVWGDVSAGSSPPIKIQGGMLVR